MRGVLSQQLSELREDWNNGLGGEVFRTAVAFPLLAMVAFAACMLLPELRERLVDYLLDLMGSITEDGAISASFLFVNNLWACLFTMFYGFLPFIYLPALSLGVNAMVLGVLAAWYVAEGQSMVVYLAALAPHGIFELPALVLAFAVGLYVCGQMTRRFRKDETARPAWRCMQLLSRALVFALIPLLAVAAVMEAYVTPLVTALFL